MVQVGLGMMCGFVFDVQVVCVGFIFVLLNVDVMIWLGQVDWMLVIGVEIFICIMDWIDCGICVLFGDGVGVLVLEVVEGVGMVEDCGIFVIDLNSDGKYCDLFYVDGGVVIIGMVGYLWMQGNLVFCYVVEKLVVIVYCVLEKVGIFEDGVDWLVLYQVNLCIIEVIVKCMNLLLEKVVLMVVDYGNILVVLILLVLLVVNFEGCFQFGQIVVVEVIGGGLVWGLVVLCW